MRRSIAKEKEDVGRGFCSAEVPQSKETDCSSISVASGIALESFVRLRRGVALREESLEKESTPYSPWKRYLLFLLNPFWCVGKSI